MYATMHLISVVVLVAVLSCSVKPVDCDENNRNGDSDVEEGEDKYNGTKIQQGKDTDSDSDTTTDDKLSTGVVIAIICVGALLTITLMGMLVGTL